MCFVAWEDAGAAGCEAAGLTAAPPGHAHRATTARRVQALSVDYVLKWSCNDSTTITQIVKKKLKKKNQ